MNARYILVALASIAVGGFVWWNATRPTPPAVVKPSAVTPGKLDPIIREEPVVTHAGTATGVAADPESFIVPLKTAVKGVTRPKEQLIVGDAPPPLIVPADKGNVPIASTIRKVELPLTESFFPTTTANRSLPSPVGAEAANWGIKTAVNAVANTPIERQNRVNEVSRSFVHLVTAGSKYLEMLKASTSRLDANASWLQQLASNVPSVSRRETHFDPQTMGRLKLSNEYNEEMSIVVNGIAHRLQPGQSRVVPVPAGSYTFQVLQLQREPQERTIAVNEEKPLRIYDKGK